MILANSVYPESSETIKRADNFLEYLQDREGKRQSLKATLPYFRLSKWIYHFIYILTLHSPASL